jgi:hypothetical protein
MSWARVSPSTAREVWRGLLSLIDFEEGLNQPELYITAETLQQTHGTAQSSLVALVMQALGIEEPPFAVSCQ